MTRSEEMDLGEGIRIRILALDALIEAKKAVGRPRDIHAVPVRDLLFHCFFCRLL